MNPFVLDQFTVVHIGERRSSLNFLHALICQPCPYPRLTAVPYPDAQEMKTSFSWTPPRNAQKWYRHPLVSLMDHDLIWVLTNNIEFRNLACPPFPCHRP